MYALVLSGVLSSVCTSSSTLCSLRPETPDNTLQMCKDNVNQVVNRVCTTNAECKIPMSGSVEFQLQLACEAGHCKLPCNPRHHSTSEYVNAFLLVHARCSANSVHTSNDACPTLDPSSCTTTLLDHCKLGCCEHGTSDGLAEPTHATHLLHTCCEFPNLCDAFTDYF